MTIPLSLLLTSVMLSGLAVTSGNVATLAVTDPASSAPQEEMAATEAKPYGQAELVATLPNQSQLFLYGESLSNVEGHIYQVYASFDFTTVPDRDMNITSVRGYMQVNCEDNMARMVSPVAYINEEATAEAPENSPIQQWKKLSQSNNDKHIYKLICKVDMMD